MVNKAVKNFLFAIGVFTSLPSMARDVYNEDKNYYPSYYEDEGKLLFKLRIQGIIANAKSKGLPPSKAASPVAVGGLLENGGGIEAAVATFLNSNIAAELSIGAGFLRTKSATLRNVAINYGGAKGSTLPIEKRKDVYMIPLTLTMQYHVAPFGAIRPYVGAGYSGIYMSTNSKLFDTQNGHGAVAQIGVDFIAKNDTLLNFDIKQRFFSSKVKYKGDIVGGGNNISSKLKINPLEISFGMGFMF